MKYENKSVVPAIYTPTSTTEGNPLLEAMPPLLDKAALFQKMSAPLEMPDTDGMSPEERRNTLALLHSFFQPMDYMYTIYDRLYRAMETTYTNQTMLETVRHICAVQDGVKLPFATQSDSGAILGVPGIGKTSTIRRCLNVIPQVIAHEHYRDQPFFAKQILWLFVECPSDCSIKTLIYNIIDAVDRAIGSNYFDRITQVRSMSVSTLTTQIKIICLNHHIGVIALDEIQNVVTTATRDKQMKPLIRFLVELTNASSTAIWLIGTPVAENVFLSEEHLKRRTRGIRLLPMKPGGVYQKFLEELWQYQFTQEQAELTEKLANLLYDRSGGIPAYLIQLFQESQSQALLNGQPCISHKLINDTAELFSIQVPKRYLQGTSISDFSVTGSQPMMYDTDETQSREYAVRRGRKPTMRDGNDLIMLEKGNVPLFSVLQKLDMVEVMPC